MTQYKKKDSHDEWRELNPPVWEFDIVCRYVPTGTDTDDKSIAACLQKFLNLARFEGFPKPSCGAQIIEDSHTR